jgi:hypothetical protein
MTIVEFLEARIAEDEAALNAVPGAAKQLDDFDFGGTDDYLRFTMGYGRAVAECAAKRAIIAGEYWEPRQRPTDAELHRRSAHPAYEYETTEGPRKRWDDPDEPPEGDGWERNLDAGRPGEGWDRFEYTEESYWRRLKPEADRKEWVQYIPKSLRAIASVYKDHPGYDKDWLL